MMTTNALATVVRSSHRGHGCRDLVRSRRRCCTCDSLGTQHEAHQRSAIDEGGVVAVEMGLVRGGVSLSRRFALGLASSLVVELDCLQALAATDYNVRLADVEDPTTRQAVVAAERGDFKLAEALFEKVRDADPNSASAWSNLGNIKLQLENFSGAEADLQQATQLAPEAPVPHLNRAIALQKLGRLEEAAEAASVAISLDSKEFAAWYNRGCVRQDQAELSNNSDEDFWAMALADFSTAADLAPGLAGYRLKQALTEIQVGEMETAQRRLRSITRRNPYYAEAFAALAAVCWDLGDKSGAEQAFAVADDYNPLIVARPGFVRNKLGWAPRPAELLDNFLKIKE